MQCSLILLRNFWFVSQIFQEVKLATATTVVLICFERLLLVLQYVKTTIHNIIISIKPQALSR